MWKVKSPFKNSFSSFLNNEDKYCSSLKDFLFIMTDEPTLDLDKCFEKNPFLNFCESRLRLFSFSDSTCFTFPKIVDSLSGNSNVINFPYWFCIDLTCELIISLSASIV